MVFASFYGGQARLSLRSGENSRTLHEVCTEIESCSYRQGPELFFTVDLTIVFTAKKHRATASSNGKDKSK